MPVSSLSCAANVVKVHGRTRRADLFSCSPTAQSPDREERASYLPISFPSARTKIRRKVAARDFSPSLPKDAIRAGSREDPAALNRNELAESFDRSNVVGK